MSKEKMIGYIRVSSIDQNPERQLECHKLDKTFVIVRKERMFNALNLRTI